jgi:hypothetical protein
MKAEEHSPGSDYGDERSSKAYGHSRFTPLVTPSHRLRSNRAEASASLPNNSAITTLRSRSEPTRISCRLSPKTWVSPTFPRRETAQYSTKPHCHLVTLIRQRANYRITKGKMVRPARLERATLGSASRCSIQLSYGRAKTLRVGFESQFEPCALVRQFLAN